MDNLGTFLMVLGLGIFFVGLVVFLSDQSRFFFGRFPTDPIIHVLDESQFEIDRS